MCGICGKLNFERGRPVFEPAIREMMAAIAHRGPDSEGIYVGDSVVLGHVRLSIIDLEGGEQPMSNEDRSVWIGFNGEIYNFQELRQDLCARGHRFRTQSDTEVIIHAYEEYGLDCVTRLRGMFAFALWDASRRRLLLARDRVGIKPLYYCISRESLAFASEIKALLALPGVSGDVDEAAVDKFWTYQFLPGPYTMFRDIVKLLPGHMMVVEEGRPPEIRQYWDLRFAERAHPLPLKDAAAELTKILREAVRQHMIADVPVGVLLSGGMDSSALLSLAASETDKALTTFTVGFDGQGIVDERPYARTMARQFGTQHIEATISAEQFWDFLPDLAWRLEEPVCEAPAVALHYITKQAREHVKVLLSGEGGDEAFAGYSNYPNTLALARLQSACGPFQSMVGRAMGILGGALRDHRHPRYGGLLPLALEQHYWSRVGTPSARLGIGGSTIYSADYARQHAEESTSEIARRIYASAGGGDLLSRMLYFDLKTWLPDDLLLKADKITMANSIELRVPLLDHKVLEFAATLPTDCKVKGWNTKRVLRKAFSAVLPADVLIRKKAGFPVPYADWLAGCLHTRVRDLLLDPHAFVLRFFDREQVDALLVAHAREKSLQRSIFSLVVLELWHHAFARAAARRSPVLTS
jgi:asparagine synthase (glutamine-hydrolysing)